MKIISATIDRTGADTEKTPAKNITQSITPNINPSSAPLRYGEVPGALIGKYSVVVISADVPALLFFKNLVDGKEDAGFLNIAESIVDSCAKHLHSGTETHIGVYERGNVNSVVPDSLIQNLIVLGKSGSGEELLHSFLVIVCGEGSDWSHKLLVVREMTVEKV